LYADRLSRRPVALVSMPGADAATLAALRSQVSAAGGQVSATFVVRSQLVDPEQKNLVDTLGVQLAQQVRGRLDSHLSTYPRIGELVGLAVSTRGSASSPAGQDAVAVRQSLAAAQLLTVPKGDLSLAPLVLVLMGSPVDQAIADGFVSGLAARARGVVALAPSRDATMAGMRDDDAARQVTTVDGSESSAGRVAAVLALVRAWTRQGGAFGASGADGAVPLG
jgi:Copper transport outer membrane protein, MctB